MRLLWIGVGLGLTVGLVGMMIAVWLVIKDERARRRGGNTPLL